MARRTAGDFLRRLIAVVPYRVHTVLTDNGTHFTTPGNTSSAAPDIKAALDGGKPVWTHAFEYACAQNDIDHRLTKPKHPWTNGQVERMNRTIKDATVKRYFYETHDQPRPPARLRRSGPGDCLSESREGVLMDAGRAVRVRPGHREVRATRPSLSPSRPGMAGICAFETFVGPLESALSGHVLRCECRH